MFEHFTIECLIARMDTYVFCILQKCLSKVKFLFMSGSLCFINVLTQKGHNFQGIRHAHFVPIRHSFQKSPQPP